MFKDKLKRPLEVGQRVAYAVTLYDSAYLKVGVIESITKTVNIREEGDISQYLSRMRHPENIIIL